MTTSAGSSAAGERHLRLVVSGPPTSRLSDEELIEAFLQASAGAAEELYDRLSGIVEATLYRMLGGRVSEFDDLVQLTFEQIVLTLRRRSFERSCRLTSWAAAIATNVALNAIRARRRDRAREARREDLHSSILRTSSPSDVHAEVAARRELDLLRLALADMKRERALSIIYHDVLGHTLREVAELMGASLPATQSRLERGRRELRERFDRTRQLTSEDDDA